MGDFLLRHAFVDNSKEKRKERVPLGTTTAGIILDITPSGIEINGYYKLAAKSDETYGTLRKPLVISWEELEKFKNNLTKPKREKKENKLEGTETEFNIEDLKKLPKVHLNGKPYYIDVERREMRAVSSPGMAFKLHGG